MHMINEAQLQGISLLLLVPCFKVLALAKVNLYVGNLETNSLVGLRSNKQVLILRVWFLNSLLISRHNSELWLLLDRNLRVVNLKEQRLLLSLRVLLLDDLVARLANFLNLASWMHHSLLR